MLKGVHVIIVILSQAFGWMQMMTATVEVKYASMKYYSKPVDIVQVGATAYSTRHLQLSENVTKLLKYYFVTSKQLSIFNVSLEVKIIKVVIKYSKRLLLLHD